MSGGFVVHVPGKPVPQGSTQSFISASTGRVVTKSDNPALKGWREDIGKAAKVAGVKLTLEPVTLDLVFAFVRPKSHFGRRSTLRKSTAPRRHIVKPDLDKLVRAVLDGLTGIAYKDDAQVISVRASKTYHDYSDGKPYASILIHSTGEYV